MPGRKLAGLVIAGFAAGGGAACSDEEPPVAPGAHQMSATHVMGTDIAVVSLEPFTFRAPLDPFHIHQLPDFKIHSNATKDIVIQRAVFAVGAGPWHTHPGPSFIYVVEGEIKVDKFSKKAGCTESEVHVPGTAYFEIANEVHRAVVVSSTPATLMVTRFNIPVGQPFTIMAPDPGC